MSVLQAVLADLAASVHQGVAAAAAAGVLPEVPDTLTVPLTPPPDPALGDFATPVAMSLARGMGRSPQAVAEAIAARVGTAGGRISRVDVAAPGFINFHLDPAWLADVVAEVLTAGPDYGRCNLGEGQRVSVEYVSANPVGPMTVVQARAGAFGDTLAKVLATCGYQVTREYYVNDAGNQIYEFAASVAARLRELGSGEPAEIPPGGYPGEYVRDVARAVAEGYRERLAELAPPERLEFLAEVAPQAMVDLQRQELASYGVEFDLWTSQRQLLASGAPRRAVATLKAAGYTYEAQGALWFAATTFGDDKDRVIIRSNGVPTYFTSDIAYHQAKLERADHVIDIVGPDHQGWIRWMRAVMAALDVPADRFEVIIVQHLRLLRGGQPVRHSKRAGELVTLSDIVTEVGRDATRYFFLSRAASSHLDFDLTLAATKSQENPAYYVQYAHARIASLLARAEATGYPTVGSPDLTLLTDPAERSLMRRLADWPEEVRLAAAGREVQRLAYYATDVARLFHGFYDTCRALDQPAPLGSARLALARATRQVLQLVLGHMGIAAPDHM